MRGLSRTTGFDLLATAERLGMAVVSEPGLWAVGPETLGGRALTTADASDFHLPDLDGDEFHISSLRGQKVLVISWAAVLRLSLGPARVAGNERATASPGL